MASVIRAGIARLGCPGSSNNLLSITVFPALSQSCGISSKSMRGGPRIPKAKPWPYQEKNYGVFQAMYDKTSHRMDENSKLILIEGPVAAGKSKLAKEIAAELDMLYVPPANMDSVFINDYGFDLRKLDDQLPEMCRSFDEKNFLRNPNHPLAAQFQIRMYMLRYSQYIDALAHILSTGQGVVLDRSVYSDFVFAEAMHKNGYLSKGAHSVYHEIKQNTINELMRPHLVIYLDCPVDVVKKRIKARNLDYEVNSKVFTDSYLADMEMFYKQHFLKDISTHAEILIYDWTAEGETEVVVEDIERVDFDVFEEYFFNKKMKDWRFPLETEWCEARIKYCSDKHTLMNYFNVPRFDVPELLRDPEGGKKWRDVWLNAPGMKYSKGYNADMGDKDLLTKNGAPLREGGIY
ncbi:NADH dehydrogenase [ubiquinone] 1 alpha subcomplex subunit 10, mitochondrial [Episyrphus balteatus]|uniref:NADH dehydrogenase [ubiquinone] 1 alpha subcomplex subunit 10, mitochondrial n=1 Tax=Episyrphus balteatus TaxID=286459 RepID=UPI002485648F|nr:NADH dehydrogenase [ubiquinone] 1 alpha subcomplex subunit 10, mitochondrial [Episyrphus balteatus]